MVASLVLKDRLLFCSHKYDNGLLLDLTDPLSLIPYNLYLTGWTQDQEGKGVTHYSYDLNINPLLALNYARVYFVVGQ